MKELIFINLACFFWVVRTLYTFFMERYRMLLYVTIHLDRHN